MTVKDDSDVDRLRQQALVISKILADAGIGPCTLPEGVLELVRRLDVVEMPVPGLCDFHRELIVSAVKYIRTCNACATALPVAPPDEKYTLTRFVRRIADGGKR